MTRMKYFRWFPGIGFNLFCIKFPLFCELQNFVQAKFHYRLLLYNYSYFRPEKRSDIFGHKERRPHPLLLQMGTDGSTHTSDPCGNIRK
jgi:hypothetical protein